MATADTRGHAHINVKRLVMWKLLTDDDTATTYDSNKYEFKKSTMSVKRTPKVETAEQFGDGSKVEDYVAKNGGDVDIALTGYKTGDGEFLFGETKTTEGVEISSSDDIVPYNCTAYMTERPDGKVNLFKLPKVKYMPQGEDSQQREGTKISFGNANIKGTYSPLISSNADCYRRLGVDPSNETDKAFIEKWFTEAAFYKTAGDT